MMEGGSGNVKTSRLSPYTLMLVAGEIRTRAGSPVGLGDAVGEAALKHSSVSQERAEM